MPDSIDLKGGFMGGWGLGGKVVAEKNPTNLIIIKK